MNKRMLIDKSIELLTEFCKNNTALFFDHMDEDAWLYGSLRGKIIHTKAEMIKAYNGNPNQMPIVLKKISANCIPIGNDSCTVVLEYDLSVLGPNNFRIMSHQRVALTWANRKFTEPEGSKTKIPRIIVADFTTVNNEGEKYKEASSFYHHMPAGQVNFRKMFERIFFHGMQKQDYYYYADTLCYISSANEGHHSTVFSTQERIPCFERLAYFEEHYRNFFIRPHNSFLINPLFIQSVSRYECKLTNGEIIPISKKRYSEFRTALSQWHHRWESSDIAANEMERKKTGIN